MRKARGGSIPQGRPRRPRTQGASGAQPWATAVAHAAATTDATATASITARTAHHPRDTQPPAQMAAPFTTNRTPPRARAKGASGGRWGPHCPQPHRAGELTSIQYAQQCGPHSRIQGAVTASALLHAPLNDLASQDATPPSTPRPALTRERPTDGRRPKAERLTQTMQPRQQGNPQSPLQPPRLTTPGRRGSPCRPPPGRH